MISCLVLPALLSEETKILTPRLSPSSLPSSRYFLFVVHDIITPFRAIR